MEANAGEPIRVVLELEAGSEPIRGTLVGEAGEVSFSGWIELTVAVEDARRRGAAADGSAAH